MSDGEQDKQWLDTDGKKLLFLFSLGMLICMPLILFNVDPGKDTSMFYTPMIREIARGNFAGGYYPMIPPLFSTVGAIFCFLGLHCFTAAKLTSTLFFVGTIFPIWGIVHRVFGKRYAFWACLTFLFCHRMIRHAGDGLIDPGKAFFLTLTVYLLIRSSNGCSIRLATSLGLALAGLTLVRGEGVMFAGIAIALALFLILRKGRSMKSMVSSVILVCTFSLAIFPWVLNSYVQTGYPVTDSRQIGLLRPVFRRLGVSRRTPSLTVNSPMLELVAKPAKGSERKQPYSKVSKEVFEGIYPLFSWLSIIGMISWHRRKKWSVESHVIIGTVILHTTILTVLLVGANAFVQKRYVIAVLPLLMGWVAIGGEVLWRRFKNRFPNVSPVVPIGIVAVVATVLIWEGNGRLHMKPSKTEAALAKVECGKWIRTEGVKMVPSDAVAPKSFVSFYHPGRLPILYSESSQVSVWVECDIVRVEAAPPTSIPVLEEICKRAGIHYVLNCGLLDHFIPDFNKRVAENANFRQVFTYSGERMDYVIYAYLPNLDYGALQNR